MPKKNFLLFIFTIFISTIAFAQIPEGYFSDGDEFGIGEQFYFGADHSFTYLYNCGDCGKKSGKGNFELSAAADTLSLHFRPDCKVITYVPEMPAPVSNDSVFFLVSLAADSTNLVFPSVQLSDGQGTNLKNIAVMKNEKYFFGVKKEEVAGLYLHVSSIGCNEVWLPLKEMKYGTQIILTKGSDYIPPWTVYQYKVIAAGKNKLELKRLDEKKSVVYRKGMLAGD